NIFFQLKSLIALCMETSWSLNTFRVDRMTTFTELLASFSNKMVNTVSSNYEADFIW
ncbi:hypothetical protein STEG23_005062, partial [Scotinomys teguina]